MSHTHLSACLLVSTLFLILTACGSNTSVTPDRTADSSEGTEDTEGSNEPITDETDGTDGDGTSYETGDQDNQSVQVRPNILLVITDDQGLDASAQFDLSRDVPVTPVIDALAASGVTYENVWATPSCTTTRAALLTGKHGVNNGVPSTPGVLSPDIGTIQQFLQQNAPEYATSAFGKWHVAGGNPDLNHPSLLGVQHYAGNLTGNLNNYEDWTVTINGVQSNSNVYHTSALVDYAIEWIDAQQSPWFTWLAFSAPHSPWHSPPEQFNRRNLSGTAADIDANTRSYYLAANGFRVDSHNAHTQPDGTYHYHGDPNALFDRSGNIASPVVGFAADGFPIYGSYIEENGLIREVTPSYQLKTGDRPSGVGSPGGVYDGSFRDDYEYIAGSGDLDECNGRMVGDQYAYFITQRFPYIVGCSKGAVDDSFLK